MGGSAAALLDWSRGVRVGGCQEIPRRFVKAMRRDQRPHLVVSTNAVRAWQEREPQNWAMVCDWLAERGKSVVQV